MPVRLHLRASKSAVYPTLIENSSQAAVIRKVSYADEVRAAGLLAVQQYGANGVLLVESKTVKARRRASNAIRRLYESDWSATLPAA
jgi:hypothetical protein